MQRSRLDVYAHFVWSTKRREGGLSPDLEGPVYRCMCAEAVRLDCKVMAVGGVEDHVHLLLALPATTSLARLMQRVKGVSSTLARNLSAGRFPGWQDNYAAISVSPRHVRRVERYIANQKAHHAANTTWPRAEALPEDDSAPTE